MDLTEWKKVHCIEVTLSDTTFWNSIEVWNSRPQLINKNISSVTIVDLEKHATYDYYLELCSSLMKKGFHKQSFLQYKTEVLDFIKSVKCPVHTSLCEQSNSKIRVVLKILFPKRYIFQDDLIEIAMLDSGGKMAVFNKIRPNKNNLYISPDITYGISFDHQNLNLWVTTNVDDMHKNVQWLKSVVIPAIVRWSKIESKPNSINSLSLIPSDEYCFLYNELKKKYGKQLCEIWTESTDPLKFVYEDIAIATYLILVWGNKKQKFVDLGCGNGLLVHILNSEGNSGIGIDVRERKIWHKYPPTTKLKVLTIRPSESALFPEYNWIIGNHSDELTPWIPVIAARSSYCCNFFLLPCCAYEFNGNKFLRRDCSVSQYEGYMNYLFNLCEVCGFRVKRDKLRIPSTKRTCFVSYGRVYNEADRFAYDDKISTFIKSQDMDNSRSNHNNEWVNDFKPRENKESVRNCTQLNFKLIDSIINLVTKTLLEKRNTGNLAEWDCGKEIHICDLVKRIPKCDLQELKKEHGGLKTLLKNHHFMFKIENDMVKFRKPTPRSKDFKHRKLKPCWFYNNHPDSCPLENELCPFIHQDLSP